jgi:anti-anti-sigma factor
VSRYGMSFERRTTPYDPTLVLCGQLDIAAVGTANAVLGSEIDAANGDVSLDLRALDFICCAGLDLLIDLARRMAADEHRLRITATNPVLDRLLVIAGVELTPTVTGEVFVPTRRTSRVPGGCGRGTRDTTDDRPLTSRPIARTDPMPDDFTIAINDSPSGVVHLTVTGEIDVLTTPQLRDSLDIAAARTGQVTIDLAAVDFIDSTALHALMEVDRALKASGACLHVMDPSPIVRRLFELTGLTDHFAAGPDGHQAGA